MRTTTQVIAAVAMLALGGCMVPPPEPINRPPDAAADPLAVPPSPTDNRPDFRAVPPADDRPVPVWQEPVATGTESAADYYWIDQADEFARVIGSAPPDFAFTFDGVEAWSWVSGDGETLLVEPARSGVIQYYYDRQAASPYLVRDTYFSYGFEGPNLVAIYDHRGQLIEPGDSRARPEEGERLLQRGRAIMAASLRRRWDRETADRWSHQSWFVPEILLGWGGEWRQRSDWQDYRRRHDDDRDREVRRHREEERRMRRDAAGRWDRWRQDGQRGPMPDGVVRPGRQDGDSRMPQERAGTPLPDGPPVRPGPGDGAGPVRPGRGDGSGPGRPRGPTPPPAVADPAPQPDTQAPPAGQLQPTAQPEPDPRPRVVPRRRPTPGEPDPVVPAITRDPAVADTETAGPASAEPAADRRQDRARIDADQAEALAVAAQRRAAADQQAAAEQAAAQQAELEAQAARRLEMEQAAREQRAQALAERAAAADAARQAQAEAEAQAEAAARDEAQARALAQDEAARQQEVARQDAAARQMAAEREVERARAAEQDAAREAARQAARVAEQQAAAQQQAAAAAQAAAQREAQRNAAARRDEQDAADPQ